MTERKLPFGKHKGKTISECLVEYLDWLIGQDWMDESFLRLKADIENFLFSSPEWQRMSYND